MQTLVENLLYINEHGRGPKGWLSPIGEKEQPMKAKSLRKYSPGCMGALQKRVLHYQICEKDKVSFLLFIS